MYSILTLVEIKVRFYYLGQGKIMRSFASDRDRKPFE